MLVIKLRLQLQDFGIDVWRQFWNWVLVEFFNRNFSRAFEAEFWSRFWGRSLVEFWSFVKILKLTFGRDCCWDLIYVTLDSEDVNSILIEGLMVAMLESSNTMMNWTLVETRDLRLKFGWDLETEFWSNFQALVWSRFWNWVLVTILKLMFGRDFKAEVCLWFWLVIQLKSNHFDRSTQPFRLFRLWRCFEFWRLFACEKSWKGVCRHFSWRCRISYLYFSFSKFSKLLESVWRVGWEAAETWLKLRQETCNLPLTGGSWYL